MGGTEGGKEGGEGARLWCEREHGEGGKEGGREGAR